MRATSNIEDLMNRFVWVEDASQLTSAERWDEQHFVDTHSRNETVDSLCGSRSVEFPLNTTEGLGVLVPLPPVVC